MFHTLTNILNRPGVADAVIQTSLSLIQNIPEVLEHFFWCNFCYFIFGTKKGEFSKFKSF